MPDPSWRQIVALLIVVLGLLALFGLVAWTEVAGEAGSC